MIYFIKKNLQPKVNSRPVQSGYSQRNWLCFTVYNISKHILVLLKDIVAFMTGTMYLCLK